ncbi:MAG: heme exporter protein CcmB [Deltaproteobacteria bacterium]
MKKIWAIVWKDTLSEFRSKEIFSSMFTFALLIIVIFNFTLNSSSEVIRAAAAGILWVAFSFAATLGLSRSFALEKEDGAIMGMLLAPCDRSFIYLGKMAGSLLFVLAVEVIILPLFAVFFNLNPGFAGAVALIFVIFLGTVGFVAVGTLFAAMALNTRLREVLVPILLFPIAIPSVVSSVKLTEAILAGKSMAEAGGALQILVSFDIIFLAASAVVFEYVIEE